MNLLCASDDDDGKECDEMSRRTGVWMLEGGKILEFSLGGRAVGGWWNGMWKSGFGSLCVCVSLSLSLSQKGWRQAFFVPCWHTGAVLGWWCWAGAGAGAALEKYCGAVASRTLLA